MANKKLPDPEMLRKLLDYDPETGSFTWKTRPASMFKRPRDEKTWNTKYSGKPACITAHNGGYLQCGLSGKSYLAHRIAWAIFFGTWPDGEIDHINGNRTDNRIKNLRAVSSSENSKNSSVPRTNTSGVVGVYWNTRDARWLAQIKVSRKQIYLGQFRDFDDAVKARKEAEKKYGFHPNHGKFIPQQ